MQTCKMMILKMIQQVELTEDHLLPSRTCISLAATSLKTAIPWFACECNLNGPAKSTWARSSNRSMWELLRMGALNALTLSCVLGCCIEHATSAKEQPPGRHGSELSCSSWPPKLPRWLCQEVAQAHPLQMLKSLNGCQRSEIMQMASSLEQKRTAGQMLQLCGSKCLQQVSLSFQQMSLSQMKRASLSLSL